MQLKEIYEEFNTRFANHPIAFEDKISSNGKANSFELSYNPISDYNPYMPTVVRKGETESMLEPAVDYTIDYSAGLIRFLGDQPEGIENISVMGYYQKCNLKEFLSFYNQAVRLMQSSFALKEFVKINGPENESVSSFRLRDNKFGDMYNVHEIYQNEDDKYAIPFEKREDLIILNPYAGRGPDYSSPGDYMPIEGSKKPGIKYPFYIVGERVYRELPINMSSLEEQVIIKDNARNQLILLIGKMMYESWLHKSWSLAQTVLNMTEVKQLDTIIQNLGMQLFGDLRNNYKPMHISNQTKQKYAE